MPKTLTLVLIITSVMLLQQKAKADVGLEKVQR